MSEAPAFGRYAEIPVDRMTPAQREGYRFLVEGPRGRLAGLYKVRRRLEALTTFNGLDGYADTRPEDQDRYGTPVEHPMVRTHPVDGSRAVYFHISKATHIAGMVIDGRATMHRAPGDYDRSQSRVLWRIIVEGDRPRLA